MTAVPATGLRVSVLLTCFFMASGAGLRCLIHFLPPSYTLWWVCVLACLLRCCFAFCPHFNFLSRSFFFRLYSVYLCLFHFLSYLIGPLLGIDPLYLCVCVWEGGGGGGGRRMRGANIALWGVCRNNMPPLENVFTHEFILLCIGVLFG